MAIVIQVEMDTTILGSTTAHLEGMTGMFTLILASLTIAIRTATTQARIQLGTIIMWPHIPIRIRQAIMQVEREALVVPVERGEPVALAEQVALAEPVGLVVPELLEQLGNAAEQEAEAQF